MDSPSSGGCSDSTGAALEYAAYGVLALMLLALASVATRAMRRQLFGLRVRGASILVLCTSADEELRAFLRQLSARRARAVVVVVCRELGASENPGPDGLVVLPALGGTEVQDGGNSGEPAAFALDPRRSERARAGSVSASLSRFLPVEEAFRTVLKASGGSPSAVVCMAHQSPQGHACGGGGVDDVGDDGTILVAAAAQAERLALGLRALCARTAVSRLLLVTSATASAPCVSLGGARDNAMSFCGAALEGLCTSLCAPRNNDSALSTAAPPVRMMQRLIVGSRADSTACFASGPGPVVDALRSGDARTVRPRSLRAVLALSRFSAGLARRFLHRSKSAQPHSGSTGEQAKGKQD